MISTFFILAILYWPSMQHWLQHIWSGPAAPQPDTRPGLDAAARSRECASDIQTARPDESNQPS